MRNLTHGIYILAIIAASSGTYLITSSGSDIEDNQPDTPNPSNQTFANSEENDTSHQTVVEVVREQSAHATASHDDDRLALDQAQVRIDALEAEVAEYQQLQRRLRDLPRQLSPERAEAQRADGRDHEWATSTELDLETMFIRDERLRDIQIEQLDCYREHCELTLNHPGSADGFPTQYFTALLKDEERFELENFNVMSIGNSESTQLILNKGESADE